MTLRTAAVSSIALSLALAGRTATAEEYKIDLDPEPGQSPPGRVCLISRSLEMRGAEDPVSPLTSVLDCTGDGCRVARGAMATRCSRCPDLSHSACKATLDLGARPADAYSVVCADDDTAPPDGGRVYIGVESVEAENPPEFYSFEVSGGRVRWSPIQPIGKPSYRVVGGDFEADPKSYPREGADPLWTRVPVRRRCRCLDVATDPSLGALLEARVDGSPTCRGVASGGLAVVEIPAGRAGQIRTLSLRTTGGELHAGWSSPWPVVPLEPVLRRFAFEWALPCTWPRPQVCPQVMIAGAECTSPGPRDGLCAFDCKVLVEGAVNPPLTMTLGLEHPVIEFEQMLSAAGARVRGAIPAASRVVTLDVSDWVRDVPGDAIRAVQLTRAGGRRALIRLSAAEADQVDVPLVGARCEESVQLEFIGERRYRPAFGRVERGGRLAAPRPDQQVVPWALVVSAGGGPATVLTPDAPGVSTQETSWAVVASTGAQVRLPGRQWFLQPRLFGVLTPAWPATALDGTGTTPVTEPLLAFGGEVLAGWTWAWGPGGVDVFAGLGGAGGSSVLVDEPLLVEFGSPMGTVVAGAALPVGERRGRDTVLSVELRYIFGGRTRHFEWGHESSATDGHLAVENQAALPAYTRRDHPAHLLLAVLQLALFR